MAWGKRGGFGKYGVAPKEQRTLDGITFASKGEKNRFAYLSILQKAGVIKDLQRQVYYPLVLPDGTHVKIKSEGFPNGRQCNYIADHVYTRARDGEKIIEDFKGHDTKDSRLRRAVVEAIYKITIRIVKNVHEEP